MENPKLKVSARWILEEGLPEITYVYEATKNSGVGSARSYDMQRVGREISDLIKSRYSLEIDEKSFEADLRLKKTKSKLLQAIRIQE